MGVLLDIDSFSLVMFCVHVDGHVFHMGHTRPMYLGADGLKWPDFEVLYLKLQVIIWQATNMWFDSTLDVVSGDVLRSQFGLVSSE